MPFRTHVPHVLATLALALLLIAGALPATAQEPASSPAGRGGYDPASLRLIKPELREKIAATLPAGMTEYEISIDIPSEPSEPLMGHQRVVFTNTTGAALHELPFRLYANSATPEHDAITIDSVSVDDVDASVTLTVDNSVATVGLPEALEPGATTTLEMAFTTRVPVDSSRHYGIFNYDSQGETWSLAHWYPVVAPRTAQDEWMLRPTSTYGDPIFTEAGFYTVTVDAPESLQLMTSGVETARETAGGRRTTTFNAWPSRDFVIVADEDMDWISGEIDGTTVTSWFQPGNGEPGKAALQWSLRAMEQFNGLLGEYPFLHLHTIEVDIPNAAGVEFPQLISIDRGYYAASRSLDVPGHFEFTVAHEIVHQWFYNLVGNNQYEHAFIDEGLTNYLSARVYFDAHYGTEAGDDIVQRNLMRPFVNAVESNTDPIVDFPTDEFPTQMSYIVAAYSKSPLGFGAIHDTMGDEAFFAALQAYVHEFSFRVATPDDLLAAFDAATDADIRALWSHWFRERNGALDIRD